MLLIRSIDGGGVFRCTEELENKVTFPKEKNNK